MNEIEKGLGQMLKEMPVGNFCRSMVYSLELLEKAMDYVGAQKNDFDDAKRLHDDIKSVIDMVKEKSNV